MSEAVVVPDLLSVDLEQSEPAIYDRPIRLRRLYVHPDTGAEHYLVRYPADVVTQRHTHTVAHTVIVLDGSLLVDGVVLGPGSYVHFPAGTVMHHAPYEGPCVFVTMFDGPFDVSPVAD